MPGKTIGAAEFKATCLRVIEQVAADREPVTITKRGRPIAILSPVAPAETRPRIVGALRGSVLRYDEPFAPATDPSDWDAIRDRD
jgi:prevent-host-death family protein